MIAITLPVGTEDDLEMFVIEIALRYRDPEFLVYAHGDDRRYGDHTSFISVCRSIMDRLRFSPDVPVYDLREL